MYLFTHKQHLSSISRDGQIFYWPLIFHFLLIFFNLFPMKVLWRIKDYKMFEFSKIIIFNFEIGLWNMIVNHDIQKITLSY